MVGDASLAYQISPSGPGSLCVPFAGVEVLASSLGPIKLQFLFLRPRFAGVLLDGPAFLFAASRD
jgi:hypothetical protein